MSYIQNLPTQQILRSRQLTRAEVLLSQYCVYFLGRMATKVRKKKHRADPMGYTDEQLLQNLYRTSDAMLTPADSYEMKLTEKSSKLTRVELL